MCMCIYVVQADEAGTGKALSISVELRSVSMLGGMLCEEAVLLLLLLLPEHHLEP